MFPEPPAECNPNPRFGTVGRNASDTEPFGSRLPACRGVIGGGSDLDALCAHMVACALLRRVGPALLKPSMAKPSMSDKVALVTGITGQDGAYLAELLLGKGYVVHGVKRRSSLFNTGRLEHLYRDLHETDARLQLHFGDLTDANNLLNLLLEIEPDEIYNLGAESHVRVSFDLPEYVANANGLGALRILEAMRILKVGHDVRFYQASSSEMFGDTGEGAKSETSPLAPCSPYAAAKLYAYWMTINYREAYGLHASNGILFNHESPLRGETFVTRKVTRAAAAIAHGRQEVVYLGNLDARRDWGHARDYVEGMWRIATHETPGDYVLATGEVLAVRVEIAFELVEIAFTETGVRIEWEGAGVTETGHDASTGIVRVRVDPRYFRPTEVNCLRGDASKARRELGWKPTTNVRELIAEMVRADLAEFAERPRAFPPAAVKESPV